MSGQVVLLQTGRGVGDVQAGDAPDRRFEVVEARFGEPGSEFGTVATEAGRLVDDEGAHVDDLQVPAGVRGVLGGVEGDRDGGAVGYEGGGGAGAADDGPAERLGASRELGGVLGPVQALGLKEDRRVAVVDGLAQ